MQIALDHNGIQIARMVSLCRRIIYASCVDKYPYRDLPSKTLYSFIHSGFDGFATSTNPEARQVSIFSLPATSPMQAFLKNKYTAPKKHRCNIFSKTIVFFPELFLSKTKRIEIKREWGRRANDNTTPRQRTCCRRACVGL